jgi:hypothetical protein
MQAYTRINVMFMFKYFYDLVHINNNLLLKKKSGTESVTGLKILFLIKKKFHYTPHNAF